MPGAYDVILLDLNGTFMFDQDRFGPDERYGATYRQLGGTTFSDEVVDRVVSELHDLMISVGRRSDRYDSFPSVGDCLGHLSSTAGWSSSDLGVVEQVVACHELGRIPEEYASVVARLAESHRLGLISNLWSRRDLWMAELDRVGLVDAFEWLVFSSDGSSTKPSPAIFNPVLDRWAGDRRRILMIGDSLSRDVAGARAVGVHALWLDPEGQVPHGQPAPDHWLRDLLDLPSSGVLE